MFSKVYFLKLWLPFAVLSLFTTLLTVYSIQPKLGIRGSFWMGFVPQYSFDVDASNGL